MCGYRSIEVTEILSEEIDRLVNVKLKNVDRLPVGINLIVSVRADRFGGLVKQRQLRADPAPAVAADRPEQALIEEGISRDDDERRHRDRQWVGKHDFVKCSPGLFDCGYYGDDNLTNNCGRAPTAFQ